MLILKLFSDFKFSYIIFQVTKRSHSMAINQIILFIRMKLWITAIFLLCVLLASSQVDAQKRRKGDKKKDSEVTTVKNEAKPEGGGKQRGRTTPTTTTTTTIAPTTAAIEEELDEEIGLGILPISSGNGVCPSELKAETGKTLPCTCIDQLEDNALMVECVALTSAQDMQLIFHVKKKKKKNFFLLLLLNSKP